MQHGLPTRAIALPGGVRSELIEKGRFRAHPASVLRAKA